MTLLDLLRALSAVGMGLAPTAAGCAVYAPRSCSTPQDLLSPELRAAIAVHRAELSDALAQDVLHKRLCVPDDVAIAPAMAVALLWLDLERAAFSQSEQHRWLDRLAALVDAGQPRWFADLWAIEEVVAARHFSAEQAELARSAA